MDQHGHDDGGAAHVRDAMARDGGEDQCGIDPSQAHVRRAGGGDSPRVGPAAAVEHGQRPEIDRARREPEGQRVAERVEVGAAVVVDDALGIARRPRGVEQADRLPLVGGPTPVEPGVSLVEEGLVVLLAEEPAAGMRRVVDVDDRDPPLEQTERALDGAGELPVGDQEPRLAVLQDEGDRPRVEAIVQRVEHGARHRHAVVRLEHGRDVGRHDGDGVAAADPAPPQGRAEPAAAGVEVGVAEAQVAMDDGGLPRIDARGPGEEGERRQRDVVGADPVEVPLVLTRPTLHPFLHDGLPPRHRSLPGASWARARAA